MGKPKETEIGAQGAAATEKTSGKFAPLATAELPAQRTGEGL